MQKSKKFIISANSVDNCGSQGKTRVSVITQSTLGCGLIKKPIFLKKKDIGKKQINFQFYLILWTIVVPKAKIGF
jgi:hypothetical protein